jgi:hypothetical protein
MRKTAVLFASAALTVAGLNLVGCDNQSGTGSGSTSGRRHGQYRDRHERHA